MIGRAYGWEPGNTTCSTPWKPRPRESRLVALAQLVADDLALDEERIVVDAVERREQAFALELEQALQAGRGRELVVRRLVEVRERVVEPADRAQSLGRAAGWSAPCPRNARCSTTWANPSRPGGSARLPTPTTVVTPTMLDPGARSKITRMPLGQ